MTGYPSDFLPFEGNEKASFMSQIPEDYFKQVYSYDQTFNLTENFHISKTFKFTAKGEENYATVAPI